MTKIKKILIPFDFSKASKNALEYAVRFSGDDENIHLHLLYVAMPEQHRSKDVINKNFSELTGTYEKALKNPIVWSIGEGNLAETILANQKSKSSDLIIMGTKSIGEEQDSDTNSSNLVMEADCPVLIVPEEDKEFSLEKIALTIGKNEIDDAKVLNILLDIARRFNAQVHVLTIDNEGSGYSPIDEKNETILEYYLENFYSHHSFPENTDIEEGILDYVENHEIDMLAIMPRNHTKRSTPSKGRLTKLLALHAQVPLLTLD